MHILKHYGFDSETNERVDTDNFEKYITGEKRAYIIVANKEQFFPTRKLDTFRYSISDTYQGLYSYIKKCLGTSKFNHKNKPKDPAQMCPFCGEPLDLMKLISQVDGYEWTYQCELCPTLVKIDRSF